MWKINRISMRTMVFWEKRRTVQSYCCQYTFVSYCVGITSVFGTVCISYESVVYTSTTKRRTRVLAFLCHWIHWSYYFLFIRISFEYNGWLEHKYWFPQMVKDCNVFFRSIRIVFVTIFLFICRSLCNVKHLYNKIDTQKRRHFQMTFQQFIFCSKSAL